MMYDATGFSYTPHTNEAPSVCSAAMPLAMKQREPVTMVDQTVERPVWVYKITHVASGKAYFGITSKADPERRWTQHLSGAFRPNGPRGPLHRALRKYGRESFTFTVVYLSVSVDEACRVERGLIAEYGTMAPRGYNLSPGGDGSAGRTFSKTTREKLRLSKLGKSPMTDAGKARLSAYRKSSPTSDETRLKISRSSTGKPWSEKERAGITAAMQSPEYKAKMSALKKGVKSTAVVSEAVREQRRERQVARMASTELRAELARNAKAMFNDPSFRAKFDAGMKRREERRRQKKQQSLPATDLVTGTGDR